MQVVSYVYDSWGKLVSITGTMKDSVGVKNPYRYRGYRYDTETGLYYLNSRYYNPEWGRFINADAVVGQIGNIQGHNMFQYCFNNPVNMDDISGYWGSSSLEKFKAKAYIALAALVAVTFQVAQSTSVLPMPTFKTKDKTKAKSKPVAIPIEKAKEKKKPTLIYRSASGTYKSLTPRPIDTGGLSFYLNPPKEGKYVVTTVEAVNATGILHAKVDGINHCSVKPNNPLTMSDWIASRDNADKNPHPYTVLVRSIVWDAK